MPGGCALGKKGDADNYQKYGTLGLKKIGVVLSAPGRADAGTNEAVTNGVKTAAEEQDADYKVLAPKDLVNNEESLRYLAENNYDIVVAVGQGMEQDLEKVAPDYTDVKFVIFDGEVEQPNVVSVKLKEDDGAFLAGVEAASLSKSNIVGYIGDSMTLDRTVETGFVRGVQYINLSEGKQVKVNVSYTGVTDKAAKLSEMAKTLADNMYWTGSDVIFSGADKFDTGVILSAAQNKKIAIGSSLVLMNTSPWNVYGALVKKEENIVRDLAKKILGGNLAGGRVGYGLAEGALDFVPSQAVPPEITAKLAFIKDQLKKSQIKPYAIQLPQDLVVRVNPTPAAGQSGTTGQRTSRPGVTQQGTVSQKQPVNNPTQANAVVRKIQKKPAGNQQQTTTGNQQQTTIGGTGTGTNPAQAGSEQAGTPGGTNPTPLPPDSPSP